MHKPNSTGFITTVILTCLTVALLGSSVTAQSPVVLARGLNAPTKIVLTPGGKLLVTEPGNGPNTARVSVLDRCGNRQTLLDAMPSGLAPPNNESDGVTALALRGRTLYLLIGEGNSLVAGPQPGTTVENPNPSSPLLSSVLVVELSTEVERLASGFTLPAAGHATLKGGASLSLQNAQAETAVLKLLVDFANAYPNPLPNFAGNVRTSHPFAVELDGNQLYIADAGLNAVLKVDINSGAASTLVSFPPLANPLPLGPPVIDAVPDGIRLFGDQLLVTLLSGFPFPAGKSEVRRVNTMTGSQESFITGLTTAIDVLPAKTRLGLDQFYVLEYTDNMLVRPLRPGRLLRFDTPAGPPTVAASNLISPVGMARDPKSGDLFITEISTGQIIQVFGAEFDVFLKDDDNGDTLRFSTLTGDYLFTSCRAGSVSLTGKGTISRSGCQLRLNNPFVSATLDRCLIAPLSRGSATIRLARFGQIFHIEGSNQVR